MTPLRLATGLLCALLAAAGSATAASARTAGSEPQAAPPAAHAAPEAPANDQAAQDRIMALVRAGKCGPAKAEATRVGDLSLADQIGAMCGARSSDPFAKRGGGGGAGGGRRGGRGG